MMNRFEDKCRLRMLTDEISDRFHSFPGLSHSAASEGDSKQTDQGRELLVSGPASLGELLRPTKDPLRFGSRPSLDHMQHLAERSL